MIHDPDRYWFDMIRDTEPYQRWARRFLGGLVLVMVGVFIGASAKAQTVPRNAAEISFTYATANTDGTAIPATCPSGQTLCGRIASTRIEYGSCGSQNSFGTKVGEISVSPPGMKALVSNLVVQTYCFRGFHRNDYSLDSVSSNVVTKTISAPTPAPPGIAIDTVAFEIKPNSSGALVATRIGLEIGRAHV